MSKKFAGHFSVLIIVSLLFLVLLVEPFCLASVDNVKPDVPSFTLKEIAQPYDIPPSTTTIIDGYTGEETTINNPGHHEENKTIYIIIKNQPFTPYKYDEYNWVNLCYEYSHKPHYSEGGWTGADSDYYIQSDSEYTLIRFGWTLPSSGQIDIRVRALIGVFRNRQPIPPESGDGTYYSFSGVEGDYGVITVNCDMPLESTTWPSSAPTTVLPTNSEYSEPSMSDSYNTPPPQQSPWATYLLIVIATVCIITVPLIIVLYHNKQQQKKLKSHSNNPLTLNSPRLVRCKNNE